MRAAGALGGRAALWLLLAARAVAAIEPVSVAVAVGAASLLTGFLSYNDVYCRLAECCLQRPLNATGRRARRAGRAPRARDGPPRARDRGAHRGAGRTGAPPGSRAFCPR